MFNNLLHKAITVGDKVFHVFCDLNINTAHLKDFAVEVLKLASQAEELAKEAQAKQEAEKPVEEVPAQPEQPQ